MKIIKNVRAGVECLDNTDDRTERKQKKCRKLT